MKFVGSRREFFRKVMGLAVVTPVLGLIFGGAKAQAQQKRGAKPSAGGELPLVTPGVGMAASVNYVHDHKDLKNAALKTERSGVPFDKQFCSNCMLYTKEGMRGGAEVGKCTLFQGQVVKGTGWCASWAKKA